MKNYQYWPLLWDDEIRATVWYPENKISSKKEDMTFYASLAKLPVQSHSLNVGIVEKPHTFFPDTDALVTFRADVPLGIVTADCVPILLYAPDVRGIAAVHAGWRGSLDGIIERTLDVLVNHSADPEKIIAIFGPSISMKNYEVDRELAERFVRASFSECVSWPTGPVGKPHLDLQEVNRQRLLRRGVHEENIHTCSLCTFAENPDSIILQSYRRDGESAGRNLTTIAMAYNNKNS